MNSLIARAALRLPDTLAGLRRNRAYWPALLLLAYALLAFYRFKMMTGAFRNSDDSGNLLAGAELAEGNWNLAGWVMAPDNYYPTDVLGQALLRLLFGFQPIFMMLWEGLVWGGVAWLGTWLACAGRPAREVPGVVIVALTMLAFNVFDHAFADWFISSIGSHGCTILLSLATFAVARTGAVRGAARLASLGGLVTIGCFSDPTFNVIACLPVLATSFLGLGDAPARSWAAGRIAVTLSGMILARVLVAGLALTGGFESVRLFVSLASFPDLLSHVAFAAESIARVLGADFFGRALGQSAKDGPYIQLLRTPLVLGLVIAIGSVGPDIWRRVRAWPSRNDRLATDDLDHMLWISAVLCVASVCMTTVINDQSCARFFLPVAVTGSVLTARLLGRNRLVVLYAGVMLPVSAAFGLMALPRHETPRSTVTIPQIRQIVTVLRALGLKHGYAGYWEGTIVTALAHREITSLPLSPGGDGRLHTFHWLANLDWYTRAARDWRGPVFFIAASQPGGLELSEADGRRQFGMPKDRIDLGQFIICVFDSGKAGFQPPVD